MLEERVRQLRMAEQHADSILQIIKDKEEIDLFWLEEKLKDYCAEILRLPIEETDDNLTLMVQRSVARALNIEVDQLPGVDQPGQCGNSTVVLSKRIHLFLAVQRGLGVVIDAKSTPKITMVRDLAKIIYSQLNV